MLDVDTLYVRVSPSQSVPASEIHGGDVQLEYDDERSGDFTPLKHVPRNKTVVLGLVTTKTGQVRAWREFFFICNVRLNILLLAGIHRKTEGKGRGGRLSNGPQRDSL